MTITKLDPTNCYRDMLEAMHRTEYVEARERALALQDWLDAGGQIPKGVPAAEVRTVLDRVLLRTIYPD